jgi:hypothetical protein
LRRCSPTARSARSVVSNFMVEHAGGRRRRGATRLVGQLVSRESECQRVRDAAGSDPDVIPACGWV